MSRSRKRRFSKNHQSSWLYGRHAVYAMLKSSTWVADTVYATEPECLESVQIPSSISVEIVESDRIEELTKTAEHQGLAARMPAFPYLSLDEMLSERPNRLLILDRIQYPMNFGTMLRSAEIFGVRHIVVAESGQSEVTASVARMSAGAVFQSRIARVESLAAAVAEIRGDGISVHAATPERGVACDHADLSGRTAIVIGRESDGVCESVLDQCTGRVLIPQDGETQSLNAAASAAILLYEASRQRRAASRPA